MGSQGGPLVQSLTSFFIGRSCDMNPVPKPAGPSVRIDRMKVLVPSSGSVWTFAQNAFHTLSTIRYSSTFDT